MRKRQLNYVKYTNKELKNYISNENSCVQHINDTVHISFPPWGLGDFKNSLLSIISRKMIGEYDDKMKGIILDVRNIKVMSNQWHTHNDNPDLHVDFNADFYIFRPQVGSTIQGIVNHIGRNQIGVIVYRVFNVSVNIGKCYKRDAIALNAEVKLEIKRFDLQDLIPTIEGMIIENVGVTNGSHEIEEIAEEDSENEEAENDVDIKKEANTTTGSDESDTEIKDIVKQRITETVVKSKKLKKELHLSKEIISSSSDSSSSDDDDSVKSESNKKVPPSRKRSLVSPSHKILKRSSSPINISAKKKKTSLKGQLSEFELQLQELLN